jgi:hypothetical protein
MIFQEHLGVACPVCGDTMTEHSNYLPTWSDHHDDIVCSDCFGYGSLREGDETVLGIVEDVSLSAYFIAGRWVPFSRVHGERAMVQPFPGLLDWGLA